MQKPLGIIVARGGSKRVPGKNSRIFCGKPLLQWSIEVGKASRAFDRFIFVTDSKEMAESGRELGVEIPFLEPPELASDTAKIFDVFHYTLSYLRDKEGYRPDWFILLEPTSPGRQPFHIQEVAAIIEARKDSIDSICGMSEGLGNMSAFKAFKKNQNGFLVGYSDETPFRELLKFKNQEVPPSYYINSAIYAFRVANIFSSDPSIWGNRVYPYIMDNKYALDIDTPTDWIVAEAKMQALLAEQKN